MGLSKNSISSLFCLVFSASFYGFWYWVGFSFILFQFSEEEEEGVFVKGALKAGK